MCVRADSLELLVNRVLNESQSAVSNRETDANETADFRRPARSADALGTCALADACVMKSCCFLQVQCRKTEFSIRPNFQSLIVERLIGQVLL